MVAAAQNGVIGKNNRLPWETLRKDWRRFRRLTLGRPVVMGRKTFESLGKPLDGRRNIVLTRNGLCDPGIETARSLEEALRLAGETFSVIGGAQVYAQALPFVTHIYMTRIHESYEGDTFFPPWDESQWEKVFQERHEADKENPVAFSFVDYVRRGAPRPLGPHP